MATLTAPSAKGKYILSATTTGCTPTESAFTRIEVTRKGNDHGHGGDGNNGQGNGHGGDGNNGQGNGHGGDGNGDHSGVCLAPTGRSLTFVVSPWGSDSIHF